MFGLEILDVVIGLTFVYLLLSLLASALNEYISALLNLRGKELARGLGRLLDDLDEKGSVKHALDGVGQKITTRTALLTEQFYNHRLIRPYATRRGWFGRLLLWIRGQKEEPRLPSYIPARTFALALLDLLGVDGKDADLARLFTPPAGKTLDEAIRDAEDAARDAAEHAEALAAAANKPDTDAARTALQRAQGETAAAMTASRVAGEKAAQARNLATQLGTPDAAQAAVEAERRAAAAAELAAKAGTPDYARQRAAEARLTANRARLAQVLAIIKQESSLDLTEHLRTLGGLPQAGQALAGTLQVQVAGLLAGAQTQLQKLHDGVEVWFNNSMDRVSGAYKRNVQGWLFAIGLGIALWMNADTIQMWRQLATNDKLRDAMAERAGRMLPDLQPRVDSLRTQPLATAQAGDSVGAPGAAQPATGTPTPNPATGTETPAPNPAAGTLATITNARRDSTTTDSSRVSVADTLRRDSIAWARFERTKGYLDSLELKLGWTPQEAVRARLLRVDSTKEAGVVYPRATRNPARRLLTWAEQGLAPPKHHADLFPFDTGPSWVKLVGLLLTALAISLGAPFWFDLLNKVISVRAAGRAPDEKPKSPQGPPKRIAEETPL